MLRIDTVVHAGGHNGRGGREGGGDRKGRGEREKEREREGERVHSVGWSMLWYDVTSE